MNLFRENCLEKKVADRLRCEETMAGCWRVLDPFFSRPTQFAQDECGEEHAPTACALFNNKSPEERLDIVRKRELCILCFRHLDTKRCWSLGKVDSHGVRGCARAHNALLQMSSRMKK